MNEFLHNLVDKK